MSVQDKLERTLREIHIMISRGQAVDESGDFVIVSKKDMLKQLTNLNLTVSEMMDVYEATKQSRDRAEREAAKSRESIVRNANTQAEDIYAASVIYTDDALGRIQDIIEEAAVSAKEVLGKLNRDIGEEKRIVRSNQMELKSQLEDLKDTAKYLRIIEERNKEIAKAKRDAKGQGNEGRTEGRSQSKETEFVPVSAEVKINEEYFEQAGLTPEGIPIEEPEVPYSKPEVKINEEYFIKRGITLEEDAADATPDEETTAEPAAMLKEDNEQEASEEYIDEELEQKLKDDLDLEYFDWRDGNGDKKEKKVKQERRFPFGKWEKF